jgi:hypothetical protein
VELSTPRASLDALLAFAEQLRRSPMVTTDIPLLDLVEHYIELCEQDDQRARIAVLEGEQRSPLIDDVRNAKTVLGTEADERRRGTRSSAWGHLMGVVGTLARVEQYLASRMVEAAGVRSISGQCSRCDERASHWVTWGTSSSGHRYPMCASHLNDLLRDDRGPRGYAVSIERLPHEHGIFCSDCQRIWNGAGYGNLLCPDCTTCRITVTRPWSTADAGPTTRASGAAFTAADFDAAAEHLRRDHDGSQEKPRLA